MADVSRREALEAITRLGAAAMLPGVIGGCSGGGEARAPQARNADLVREENARKGSREWMLSKTHIDAPTKYRSPRIEGYFSKSSVKAGETISLHVSTNPDSVFSARIYRMGYYGGDGGRLVADLGELRGGLQEDPPEGTHRLRECRWESAATLTVPKTWPSGVYVAKLTALQSGGFESYAVFIVRDDRACDFLVQCSDTTWQAYNRWPSQYSLYDDGKSTWYWGAGVDVSLDRPFGKYCQILDQPLSIGSGEWFLWEFPAAYWMESQGYDVSYISNLDTHADAAGLRRAKGLISVGHDEYYSLSMFQNLKAAIVEGLSVAFLSGNTCCGLLEIGPSTDGRPNRILRRIDRFGPRDETGDRIFVAMKNLPRTGPNEATLIGARSTGSVMGGSPYLCSKPGHWLFEGTGMKEGDGIPGLVGWEWHGDPADIPGLEIVSKGVIKYSGMENQYTSTIYPGPKGNVVFNAASCWWSDGLGAPPGYLHPKAHGAEPKGPDPRAQRITANLLARMRSV